MEDLATCCFREGFDLAIHKTERSSKENVVLPIVKRFMFPTVHVARVEEQICFVDEEQVRANPNLAQQLRVQVVPLNAVKFAQQGLKLFLLRLLEEG